MNFEIYTTNLKQAIQKKKEQYIVNSFAKAEQQQAQLAVADIEALKRDLPSVNRSKEAHSEWSRHGTHYNARWNQQPSIWSLH